MIEATHESTSSLNRYALHPTPQPKCKYFLYARKSSEPDDRQVLSIESQKAELLKLYEDLNIIEIIEEAKSAKAPGRPSFSTMMDRIENGEANGLIVWHPDRLARNSVDGGRIIYDLDQGKLVDLKFPQYHFENSPEGKWMLSIIFGLLKNYMATHNTLAEHRVLQRLCQII